MRESVGHPAGQASSRAAYRSYQFKNAATWPWEDYQLTASADNLYVMWACSQGRSHTHDLLQLAFVSAIMSDFRDFALRNPEPHIPRHDRAGWISMPITVA